MHKNPLSPLVEEPAIVFETDAGGAWTHVSPLWVKRTGQAIDAAMGFGWLEQIHPDDRAKLEAAWRARCIGRHLIDLQFRLVTNVWFRARATPSFTAAGLVGFITDLTLRRAAEGQINRLAARSQALLDWLPDMLVHVDRAGVIVDFQAPPEMPILAPPSVFLGKPMGVVLPPILVERAMQALELAQTTNQTQRYEYVLFERDFEARVTPMSNGEFLFIIRDVSERKQVEAELIASRENALEASRLKSQFLANVSHESRTPLNGILGVTQLLRTMSLPNEAHEYLDVLQGSGQSLLDIVNDVLDLSKIEANRLALESEVFDVALLVTQATRAFAPAATKKGLTLECTVAPAARAAARGDPARLRQVVNNLVGNALKFTETGSVRVTVDRDGDTLMLHVRDTGIGIPADRHSAIFEPFVQGDGTTSRRFGGTGLGLTICRRLVQLMGGDITVESEPSTGSIFRVRVDLPCAVIDRIEDSWSTRPRPGPRPMRVLLAEDNAINARMTSALIEKLGHRVEVVINGQQALDALLETTYDLVLMDVQMPIVDGLEATRRIRSDETSVHRHVPIVALTANVIRGDDLICLSAGMDAYLPKPITVDALNDMLVWFGER